MGQTENVVCYATNGIKLTCPCAEFGKPLVFVQITWFLDICFRYLSVEKSLVGLPAVVCSYETEH